MSDQPSNDERRWVVVFDDDESPFVIAADVVCHKSSQGLFLFQKRLKEESFWSVEERETVAVVSEHRVKRLFREDCRRTCSHA